VKIDAGFDCGPDHLAGRLLVFFMSRLAQATSTLASVEARLLQPGTIEKPASAGCRQSTDDKKRCSAPQSLRAGQGSIIGP